MENDLPLLTIYLQVLLSGFQWAITIFFFTAWNHTRPISPYYIHIFIAVPSFLAFHTGRVRKSVIHKIGSWFSEVGIIPLRYIAITLN